MPASSTLFFALSKSLGFLTLASNVLAVLALVGVLLMAGRFARLGRRLLLTVVLLLLIAGFSPLGRMLMLALERQFPAWDGSCGAPDGIVVLGGPIDVRLSAARATAALNEGAERLTAAAELARRYPDARLIYSGGSARLLAPEAREAPVAQQLLVRLGVPEQRIAIEERSRNTAENAAFSKALANPQPGERWLLVTSAFHMPRSIGVFRKAGFPVEAYPVDWRTAGPQDMFVFSDTFSIGLRRLDTAVHEWIGLFIYWLTGRTTELLPGPDAGCETVPTPPR